MMSAGMTSFARRIFLFISALSFGGVAVSSVSLYHHYGTSQTSYCDFGESFNCDLVNRSTYSTISGIPVAFIGMAGYLGLLVLATFYRNQAETPARLALASLAGFSFALYLTYVEAFVLAAWCVLCLSSLAIIFCILLLASTLWRHQVRRT
jgi:uncharacterized membrane protein